jgi:glycosyltransferase involved in cell wall biosynthesis
MPKVSIIIPAYNRSRYLKLSIKSIIEQDFQDFEIIVSDNASTEDLSQIITTFNDNRIIYHKNKTNVGMTMNHNKALELCSGEYIHIFSDDDLMLDHCIKNKVKVLEEYPTVGLVHSDINIIDSEGRVTSKAHWASLIWKKWEIVHSKSKFFSKEDYHKYLYRIHNIISMPSVMIRRSVIDKIGFMDPEIKYFIDWQYWLKITLFWDVFYLNQKLVSYRSHDSNVFKEMSKEIIFNELNYIKFALKRDFSNDLIVKENKFWDTLQKNNFYKDYSYFKIVKLSLKKLIKKLVHFIS